MIALKRILVASDFSEASRGALEIGRSLADLFGAELHLVHVVADPLHEPWLGYTPAVELVDLFEHFEANARIQLEAAVAPDDLTRGHVVVATTRGDPADEILRYSVQHHIDLIVCGTHGRRGWDHVAMGSVAERIVRLARCPVLTVHASAHQTHLAA